MKNIPLQVNIEGQDSTVDTDWLAIMATLKKRGLSQSELSTIYQELSAGMRVTTRGLTLAEIKPSIALDGIIRETKFSENDYVGMMRA
ncbi:MULTISPECIES: hypothetical protein [Shewanella]|uniref:Uncharacterized protein n=1 Tax=Shewanella nanhaiensis TaxID=2864872 RepID=A0ABS7E138_9GAMM|nr:hypothetical protein [Shewanella nanhaiensis]MBW8183381.1 hypothetical protein [Shewanella nanhaiensis]